MGHPHSQPLGDGSTASSKNQTKSGLKKIRLSLKENEQWERCVPQSRKTRSKEKNPIRHAVVTRKMKNNPGGQLLHSKKLTLGQALF
jgi:hypothetical protein